LWLADALVEDPTAERCQASRLSLLRVPPSSFTHERAPLQAAEVETVCRRGIDLVEPDALAASGGDGGRRCTGTAITARCANYNSPTSSSGIRATSGKLARRMQLRRRNRERDADPTRSADVALATTGQRSEPDENDLSPRQQPVGAARVGTEAEAAEKSAFCAFFACCPR
jgi:hypothetical protein